MRAVVLRVAATWTAVVALSPLLASAQRVTLTGDSAAVDVSTDHRAPQRGPEQATGLQHDSLTIGGRTIAAGSTVAGPVVVAGGDLDVYGTVSGSAIAIAGDVIVHQGGRVSGDAIAAFGSVRPDGGIIEGTARSMTGTLGASLRSSLRGDGAPASTSNPVMLALGWFGVMLLIGLGVLVFAGTYLDGVVDVLEDSFWRSFMAGIAGELGIVPALVLLCVALAITVLGALLIPFAVVAVVLAVAGLAALGFVAVARITGDGLATRSARRLTVRGGALRAVLVGISVYMGLWLIATALGWAPVAGALLRLVALIATYVAVTAGFGAALLSRAGTRRDTAVPQAPAPAMDAASWATPTPVTGVVAARRPSPKADVAGR